MRGAKAAHVGYECTTFVPQDFRTAGGERVYSRWQYGRRMLQVHIFRSAQESTRTWPSDSGRGPFNVSLDELFSP
jgi:hypothetical protein